VASHLHQLGLSDVGSPTTLGLMALYVSGLILLEVHQTQTRVTHFLPARCHDALNRLLRLTPFSTRVLMGLLMRWVKGLGQGYLSLDDVIVEKAFAKRLAWAGWTYAWSKQRKVYGLHIVVLVWCSLDGRWRIPVAFRLWRPKRTSTQRTYRTKLQLAEAMLKDVVALGLRFEYVVFDTHYTAGWLTKLMTRLNCRWVGTLDPKTHVVYRGHEQRVDELARQVRLKWRKRLQVRATALSVYAPKYGDLRLVVTRNRHGNYEYIVSNDLTADLTTLVQRKMSRWSVETVFRDTKQLAGLGACQCWVDQAMVRHIALVLLTFVVLQRMRLSTAESVGAVKVRWQLEAIRFGQSPPPPLKACPSHLRMTA
jgi:hypothetical protein